MPPPRRCCIPVCDNSKNGNSKHIFHAVKNGWKPMLKNLYGISCNGGSKICEKHFEASMYANMMTGSKRLLSTAVPSLQLPPPLAFNTVDVETTAMTIDESPF
ncbi:uncharacterized protein LOC131804458 [Musca domestica]|uniref:Uncharacterized protein LOC131804458 n=1 Tax=Musca domestica TaxID=7370 RepID=A0ABM3VC49_MUSDO|nr:uncharacterized protein LOC131804458 [Musca domestica]